MFFLNWLQRVYAWLVALQLKIAKVDEPEGS